MADTASTPAYTTRKEIEARINGLRQYLTYTDYKAIKAYEGHPSADWDDVQPKREAAREEINDLEETLETLPPDDDDGGME